MKIVIIYPTRLDDRNRPVHTRAREGKILNLSFIYLAGLTPLEHEVDVVDELFEPIDFDAPVDLVAITAMTSQAERAYQIAHQYQKRKIPVVMGGFHATFLPEEPAAHVDAVVIGEAEGGWEKVLADAAREELETVYENSRPLDTLAGLPSPRYDLIARKPYRYKDYPVWVGRGCPHDYSYCTVKRFYGPRLRSRPVADVLKDIEQLPTRRVMFVDDNLFACRSVMTQLLPALSSFQLQWLAQVDPGTADDDHLLDLARAAGMETAYIGFENFSQEGLQKINKNWARAEAYHRLIGKLHQRGIIVFASMILGISGEDAHTIRATLRQIEALQIDELALYILTPCPGSRMWEELAARQLDLPRNWSLCDGSRAVCPPPGMETQQMEALYWFCTRILPAPFRSQAVCSASLAFSRLVVIAGAKPAGIPDRRQCLSQCSQQRFFSAGDVRQLNTYRFLEPAARR